MLRSDLIYWSERIVTDLQENEISRALSVIFQAQRGDTQRADSMGSYPISNIISYQVAISDYNSSAIEIMKSLGVQALIDREFWEAIFSSKTPTSIRGVHVATRNVLEFLPRFIVLMTREADTIYSVKSGNKNGKICRICLIEGEKDNSSPERIVKMLQSVSDLYEVLTFSFEKKESNLQILSIDSGSDKSFDFSGISSILKEIREIIFWSLGSQRIKILQRCATRYQTCC